MIYYQVHSGDYAKETKLMTEIEECYYMRLRNLYHEMDGYLPADISVLATELRIAPTMPQSEDSAEHTTSNTLVFLEFHEKISALKKVLARHFLLTAEGYIHKAWNAQIARKLMRDANLSNRGKKAINARWDRERMRKAEELSNTTGITSSNTTGITSSNTTGITSSNTQVIPPDNQYIKGGEEKTPPAAQRAGARARAYNKETNSANDTTGITTRIGEAEQRLTQLWLTMRTTGRLSRHDTNALRQWLSADGFSEAEIHAGLEASSMSGAPPDKVRRWMLDARNGHTPSSGRTGGADRGTEVSPGVFYRPG